VHIQKLLSWIESSIWDLPYSLDAYFNSVEVLRVVVNPLYIWKGWHIGFISKPKNCGPLIQFRRCDAHHLPSSSATAMQLQGTIRNDIIFGFAQILTQKRTCFFSRGCYICKKWFKWDQDTPYPLWGKVARKIEARWETNESLTL